MPTTANPLVSVMIPYYNCKEYIAETIASVEAQSYPDIEIIVIDDGSRQEDAAYLQNLLAGKSHIRFAVQSNCGVAAARNHAARLASGKYFLFLDADDTILPEYIEKCVNVLENDATCKLVYPQAEFFDAQSGVWELPAYEGFKSLLMGNKFPSVAFHRAADHAKLNGFDESLCTHEDWDYWIRMLKDGGYAQQIPEVLFRYRKRNDDFSLTNQLSANPEMNRSNWQKVCNKHQEAMLENNLGYVDFVNQLSIFDKGNKEKEIKIGALQTEIILLTDKIEALKQQHQNAVYRSKQNETNQYLGTQSVYVDNSNGYEYLRYIYHSPSYKIIRLIKKLNWKIKKRPKKPYYYPSNNTQCWHEAFTILNSLAWNLLGTLHFLYRLLFRNIK